MLCVICCVTDVNLFFSSSAKPISLVERCYCRSTVNNLPKGYIRELRFIHTPNCPFQVMWVLFWIWASVGGNHTNTQKCMFSTLALKCQTGFLLIGHFSPSISERWQDREKSCACMCIHTPLCHLLSHTSTKSRTCAYIFTAGPQTHPQEELYLSMRGREREVETGCSFVLNRKSNNCRFSNWVCFSFACHAAFPHTVVTTFSV